MSSSAFGNTFSYPGLKAREFAAMVHVLESCDSGVYEENPKEPELKERFLDQLSYIFARIKGNYQSNHVTATALHEDKKRARIFISQNTGFDKLDWHFQGVIQRWFDGEEIEEASPSRYIQMIQTKHRTPEEIDFEDHIEEELEEVENERDENPSLLADLKISIVNVRHFGSENNEEVWNHVLYFCISRQFFYITNIASWGVNPKQDGDRSETRSESVFKQVQKLEAPAKDKLMKSFQKCNDLVQNLGGLENMKSIYDDYGSGSSKEKNARGKSKTSSVKTNNLKASQSESSKEEVSEHRSDMPSQTTNDCNPFQIFQERMKNSERQTEYRAICERAFQLNKIREHLNSPEIADRVDDAIADVEYLGRL